MYPMFKLNLAMFAHYLAVKWKDKLFHFLNIVNNFSTISFYLKHVLLQVQGALGFQNLSIELSGSERKFTRPVQNNQVDTGTTSLLQYIFFDKFYPRAPLMRKNQLCCIFCLHKSGKMSVVRRKRNPLLKQISLNILS